MPLVSVIIAAHNAVSFLRTAVSSALNQEEVALEVLVVDDGSVDDTPLLLKSLATEDVRVRYWSVPESCGPSVARNVAIDNAKGEWIAVLDADDSMEASRLRIMLDKAENLECDLLADNLKLIDFSTGDSLGLALNPEWMRDTDPLTLRNLLDYDWPGKHSGRGIGFVKPIIKREFLTKHALRYDSDIKAGEDFMLYARAIDNGARFFLIEQALYLYSVRSGSVSSQASATRYLAEVNQRVAGLPSAVSTGINFKARADAFWYQYMIVNLKDGHLWPARLALKHISLTFLLSKLVKAAQRRTLWKRQASRAE